MVIQRFVKEKWILINCIVFLLPIYINLTFIFIDLWVIIWLFEGGYYEKFKIWKNNKYLIFLSLFFLMHLVGLLYSSNKPEGKFELHCKYTVFLFPILLATEGAMDFKQQKRLIKLFVGGCISYGFVCLIHSSWLYFTSGSDTFQYIKFAWFTHPSYVSMYYDVAFILIFYLLVEVRHELSKREKVYLTVSLFFLEFVVILLQSKTGIIVSLLLLAILLGWYAVKLAKYSRAVIIFLSLMMLSFLTDRYIIDDGNF